MPAGDGTGPNGMGPMTGRGAGYCAGYDAPGYANLGPGRGFGMGRGRGGGWGRGWRHRHWFRATGVPGWARPAWGASPGPYAAPQPTAGQEAEALKAQAQWLQEELAAIEQRLSELEVE